MTIDGKHYLLLSASFACGALWREDTPLNQLSIGQWGELVLTSLGAPLLGLGVFMVLGLPLGGLLFIVAQLLGGRTENDPLPPQR